MQTIPADAKDDEHISSPGDLIAFNDYVINKFHRRLHSSVVILEMGLLYGLTPFAMTSDLARHRAATKELRVNPRWPVNGTRNRCRTAWRAWVACCRSGAGRLMSAPTAGRLLLGRACIGSAAQ
jgi:hypothetical protein